MTSTAAQASAVYRLHLGQGSPPIALSSVQLPTQPASSSNTNTSAKYKHVLTTKAISPQMDLVAIISRDVASSSAGIGSSSSALNPSSVLAPPPPGMSAAANQARIRMMMMARARALAAAGLPANGAGPSFEAPKVTPCAPIRLSLWRMASLVGEQGSRVWDVEIKVPSLFKDLGKDIKEMEHFSVSSMTWSPDSRSIALAVLVRRRSVEGNARRQNRFLIIYDMQDGAQRRVIRIPSAGQEQQSMEGMIGLEWCQLTPRRRDRAVPGSATYVLQHMKALPDNSHFTEDKDSKARQRQRAINAMRNTSQKQGEVDRKLKEEMLSDTGDWTKCLLDHPRSDEKGDEEDQVKHLSLAILCAWDDHRLHLFLDANVYLGSIALQDKIHSVNVDSRSGNLILCTDGTNVLTLQTVSTGLDQQSARFSSLLDLQALSTMAFSLFTYCYDSIVDLRNLYRSTHINCITPWFRKGKSIERQYSTHFQTELQILLLTSSANEAITSLLVGNETMTEGNLNKMKAEMASAWIKSEALFDSVFQALQRISIVFQEVRGCWLWQEQYSAFLPTDQGAAIETILDLVGRAQKQSLTSLRHVQHEMRCWSHFYKWFKYERTRQEAIRDQVAEQKSDISYDVLLIADFLKRGFVNYHLEECLGITLDKKTRGAFVENEDEEDDEAGGDVVNGQGDSTGLEEQLSSIQDGSHFGEIKKPIEHDDLLKILQEMQRIPDPAEKKKNSAPSQGDLSCLLASPFLITGSSKGLSERRNCSTKDTMNIFATVKKVLELSSGLFSQAFAEYASQDHKVHSMNIALPSALMPLRQDALYSMAISGSSTDTKISLFEGQTMVRSCFDHTTGQQWLLGMYQEGSESIITVINYASDPESIKRTSVQCQGDIIDMGFYSCREVAVLLRDSTATRMLSFQIDSLDFSPSQASRLLPIQRCYEMQADQISSGALQLSLNHAKDVAATLDDHGSLVYWDFVQLGETKDEDHEMGTSV